MTTKTIAELRARILSHLKDIPNAEFDVVMVEGGCLIEYCSETYINSLILKRMVGFHKSLSERESAFPLQIYHYLKKTDVFQKMVILRREIPTLLGTSNDSETFARIRLIDADAFHYRVFRPFKFEVKLKSAVEQSDEMLSSLFRVIEIDGGWHHLIGMQKRNAPDGSTMLLISV